MRRQGAHDCTSGGEEIGQSHLTLETKADYPTPFLTFLLVWGAIIISNSKMSLAHKEGETCKNLQFSIYKVFIA